MSEPAEDEREGSIGELKREYFEACHDLPAEIRPSFKEYVVRRQALIERGAAREKRRH